MSISKAKLRFRIGLKDTFRRLACFFFLQAACCDLSSVFPFTYLLSSSGRERAMFSGCLAGAHVPPARTPGRNPKEKDGAVVGGSRSSHLATVP